MISVYPSERALPGRKPVIFLWPFLGLDDKKDDVDYGRFAGWLSVAKSHYSIVPAIEKADLCVYSYELKHEDLEARNDFLIFEKKCKQNGKPVFAFDNEDSTELLECDHAKVFCTSYYRSSKKHNTLLYLGWAKDMNCYRDVKDSISKATIYSKPDIAYCGYGSRKRSWPRFLARSDERKLLADSPGSEVRGRCIEVLRKDRRVRTSFAVRQGFLGGVAEARGGYVDNMFSASYGLCARGAGNFSYRFVELLSAGVIPLFVDSDMELPFEDEIEWESLMPIVPVADLDRIGDILVEFHANNWRRVRQLRLKMCLLFEEYLRLLSCRVGAI